MPNVKRCRAACAIAVVRAERETERKKKTVYGHFVVAADARRRMCACVSAQVSVSKAADRSSPWPLVQQRRSYPFFSFAKRNATRLCCVARSTTVHGQQQICAEWVRKSANDIVHRSMCVRFSYFFCSSIRFFHVAFSARSRILFYAVWFFFFFFFFSSPPTPMLMLLLFFFVYFFWFRFVFGDVRVGKCLTNSSKCTQETVYLRYRYDAVVQKDFIYSVPCWSLCLFVRRCLSMNFEDIIIFFLLWFSNWVPNEYAPARVHALKSTQKLLQSQHCIDSEWNI